MRTTLLLAARLSSETAWVYIEGGLDVRVPQQLLLDLDVRCRSCGTGPNSVHEGDYLPSAPE